MAWKKLLRDLYDPIIFIQVYAGPSGHKKLTYPGWPPFSLWPKGLQITDIKILSGRILVKAFFKLLQETALKNLKKPRK